MNPLKTDWSQHIPFLAQKVYLAACERSILTPEVQKGVSTYLDSWGNKGSDWEGWLQVVNEAKAEFARLINALPEEIALATSLSGGIASIASALNWQGRRRRVITTEADFSGLNLIWAAQAKWGCEPIIVPGSPNPAEYASFFDDRTLLVAATHICPRTGEELDVSGLVETAQKAGVMVLLDAYLSLGTIPIDVKALDVDYLVGGVSKYLMGVPGLAFIYIAPRALAGLKPALTGWFGQEYPFSFAARTLDYAGKTRRLETGTPPILAAYAAREGIKLINDLNPASIQEHNRQLLTSIDDLARDWGYIKENKPKERVFYSFPSKLAQQIQKRLREKRIITSARGDYLRLAPHFYNRIEEVEKACKELLPLLAPPKPSYNIPQPKKAKIDLVIKNGQVVIPGTGTIKTDLVINEGCIVGWGQTSQLPHEEIDAEGHYVLPGIVDPHIHLGIFAQLEEDIAWETRSALLGGVTTCGLFLGGEGSHLPRLNQLAQVIKERSYIDIWPHLVLTEKEQLEELKEYLAYGVGSFKMYMCGIPGLIPSADDGFIYSTLQKLKDANQQVILCLHAENAALVEAATAKIKETNPREGTLKDWASTHPNLAEAEAVQRALFLNQELKVPLYLVHLSTKEALAVLAEAKKKDPHFPVFGETTPFYLACNHTDAKGLLLKMVPPIREQASVDALWRAIKEEIIDTIGTDNTTQDLRTKNLAGGIWGAMPGYPALATSLPVILDEGVHKRGLSINQVSMLMSRRPAEIFGLYPQKGTLMPGSDADLVIVDLEKEKRVHHSELGSRADFSVFDGRTLKGWPVMTIKGGRLVMAQGELLADRPKGQLILQRGGWG